MRSTAAFQDAFLKLSEELSAILSQVEEHLGALNQSSTGTWEKFKLKMADRIGEWRATHARVKALSADLPRKSVPKDTLRSFKKNLNHFDRYVRSSARDLSDDFSKIPWSRYLDRVHHDATRLAEQIRALRESPAIQTLIEEGRILARRTDLQWGRKIFHTACGLTGLWLWGYSGLSEGSVIAILGSCLTGAILTEIVRRVWPQTNDLICRQFSGIMRERERTRISSATWYMGAVLVVFLLFPKAIGILTLFYVAVGDTVAGIVGIVWGRHKVGAHASLEGMGAMFLTCLLGTLAFLPAGMITSGHFFLFAVFCGLVATFSECSVKKLDDNLTIPLFSAPAVWLLTKIF